MAGTEKDHPARAIRGMMPREGRLELVTFDLDGTLIDGTAFMLVARAFGFEDEILRHDARFRAGEISLEECFAIEFDMLKGKTVTEVHAALETGTWFPGITDAVRMLKDAGLRVAVLTDNPDFVTDHLRSFGIEEHIASHGVLDGGVVTGEVHARFDKWGNLDDYLVREGIPADAVAHIGNDVNDVRVWEHVGLGVCVEPTSPTVRDAATLVFHELKDLREVAQAVLDWDAGLLDD